MSSDIIKRGTKITPNLIQAIFLDTYHNLNQIPFSNIVLSSKQFRSKHGNTGLEWCQPMQGAYNDSIVQGKTNDYLATYVSYVNMLKDM